MSQEKVNRAYRDLCFKLLVENKQLLDIADNAVKRGTSSNEEIKTLFAIKQRKTKKQKHG